MKHLTSEHYKQELYPDHLNKMEACLDRYPVLEPWPALNNNDLPSTILNILFDNLEKNNIKNPEEIKSAIETGTFDGHSSMHFAGQFDNVHTVEKYVDNFGIPHYKKIKDTFPNIHFYGGDSPVFLKDILTANPNERFFFWLDAHNGTSEVPLLSELSTIKNFSKRNDHVIMIDDGHDMGWGLFPTFDIITAAVKEINPNYNLVNTKYGRDIMIALLA